MRASLAPSGISMRFTLHRIDLFDLAVVGVCDVELAVGEDYSQWMLKPDRATPAVYVTEVEESLSDNRRYRVTGRKSGCANRADFAVGKEEMSSIGGDPAGLSKRRLLEGTMDMILTAAAGIWMRLSRARIDDPGSDAALPWRRRACRRGELHPTAS